MAGFGAAVRQWPFGKIVLSPIDGRAREAGDAGDHLERSVAGGLHLARRPQPPAPLVKLGAHLLPPLPDPILVNLAVSSVMPTRYAGSLRAGIPRVNPSRPLIAIHLP